MARDEAAVDLWQRVTGRSIATEEAEKVVKRGAHKQAREVKQASKAAQDRHSEPTRH
jgi:hypothetical protein